MSIRSVVLPAGRLKLRAVDKYVSSHWLLALELNTCVFTGLLTLALKGSRMFHVLVMR